MKGKSGAGRVYLFREGTLTSELSSLTINPSSVKEGDSVTISCDVTNTGTLSGSHTVTLKIDEEVRDEKTVSLDAGGSETVSFEVNCDSVGEFMVDINGETSSYEVTEAQTGIPGFPYNSIVLGLVVGVLVRARGKSMNPRALLYHFFAFSITSSLVSRACFRNPYKVCWLIAND